jgi:hypothetical protein
MNPTVYGHQYADIKEVFKRIDTFLMDYPLYPAENLLVLNKNDVKNIKILICDLTAIEGLKPKELKKREELVYELISRMSIYYLSKKDEINVINNFFKVPEKA